MAAVTGDLLMYNDYSGQALVVIVIAVLLATCAALVNRRNSVP